MTQPPQYPQSGQPQQPMQPPPGQAPQPFQPNATLKFTVQGHILTSNMVSPTLRIDGHNAPTTIAGSTMIPIQSGRHHLETYSQWMRQYGQASLDVDIPPNSTVEVFYAAPWHQFATGAMGLTPQTRNGRGLAIGFLVGALVIALLIAIPIVVSGMSG